MRCILLMLCSRPHLHMIYKSSLTQWNLHYRTLPPMYQVDSCGRRYVHFKHIPLIEYIQSEAPAFRRPTNGPSALERRALLHALSALPSTCRTIVKVTAKYYIHNFTQILRNFSDNETIVQSRTEAWLQRSEKCGGHRMKSSEVFQIPVDRLGAMLHSHKGYMECAVGRLSNVSHFSRLNILRQVLRSDGSVLSFL